MFFFDLPHAARDQQKLQGARDPESLLSSWTNFGTSWGQHQAWGAGRSRSRGSRTRRTGRWPSRSGGEGCWRRPTSSPCSATPVSASSSSPAPAGCSSTPALLPGPLLLYFDLSLHLWLITYTCRLLRVDLHAATGYMHTSFYELINLLEVLNGFLLISVMQIKKYSSFFQPCFRFCREYYPL